MTKSLSITLPDRLRLAREEAGLTQQAVADRFGIDKNSISNWERDPKPGARKPARPDIERLPGLAHLYGKTIDELLTGKAPVRPLPPVPIVGYVGAGAEIFPIDDHAKGGGHDEAPPFPGQEGPAVAVWVRGDSMLPQIEDGWILYYSRDRDGVPSACAGKLCVVQVSDGPTLVKKLEPGKRKGLWRLVSYNASPREDVKLDWAARVLAIVP